MIRIAVLLSGQIRHWQTASKLFKLWNDMDSEVSYDFFMSTWDDSYRGENAKDADLSMCVASEILSPSIIDIQSVDFVKYPYLLKRTNLLKNVYEEEQDFKYNAVLATRPDIIIGPEILKDLVYNIKSDYIGNRTLFICNGIQEKKCVVQGTPILKGTQKKIMSFVMNDFFVYGHSIAVNTFAEMYDDLYIKKKLQNTGVHTTPAQHVVSRRLNNRGVQGFTNPIRYTSTELLEDMYESGQISNFYLNTNKGFSEFKKLYFETLEQYNYEVHIQPKKQIIKNEERNFSRKL